MCAWKITGNKRLGLMLLVAGFWAFTGEGAESSVSVAEEHEGVIVAMGDSLTAGYGLAESDAYPALLQERLSRKGYAYRVINAGVSGETSSGALSRVHWVLRLKPDIVILETGANDGLRGIDPKVLEANLTEIVDVLQKNGVTVILAGMRMMYNLGEAYTEAFGAVYPRVAQNRDAALIPFFLEGVAGDPRLNLRDAIHPNREGYERIAETVLPYVVRAIERSREGGIPEDVEKQER